MDATAVDKQVATLRETDAVVANRLAELDGKLTAWFEAMRVAFAALKALKDRERLRPEGAAASGSEVETPQATAAPTERSDPAAAARPPAEVFQTPPAAEEPSGAPCRGRVPTRDEAAVGAQTAGREGDAAESAIRPSAKRERPETTAVVQAPDAATADAGLLPSGDTAAEQAPATAAASATDPAAEDEALLAQLDPETANALRVKRRLSGNRKSIRQLLDEMQARGGQGPPPTTGKSKRWWR